MITKIIGFILLGLLAAYLLIWTLSGGIGRTVALAHTFGNPFKLFGQSFNLGGAWFQLPWQVAIPQGPSLDVGDIPTDQQDQHNQSDISDIERQVRDLEMQYESIQREAQQRGLVNE
jgi:hypothetical protein